MTKTNRLLSILVLLIVLFTLSSCDKTDSKTQAPSENIQMTQSGIPEYTGDAYTVLNDNDPAFTDEELVTRSYETYSELDSLGRCGVVMACIGTDIMPTEDRGSIGQVKPSGWHTVKYDHVDGKYLYNRCHLIGFQLTGENANEQNLITGTRYMNVDGMLPFENMVADYVKETDNHVIYRVTPVFEENDLVAKGVIMQAQSVEDNGEGISFNVFVHNIQPGVTIDYKTGESSLSDQPPKTQADTAKKQQYVLNTNTKKFHVPDCSSAKGTKPENKKTVTDTRENIIKDGYSPCGNCKP